MNFYDGQLYERAKQDNEAFSGALRDAALAMNEAGTRGDIDRTSLVNATGEILTYFGLKDTGLPGDVVGIEDILDYRMRRNSIMYHRVRLEEGWKKNGALAMIAFRKGEGEAVALIPGPIGGYVIKEYIRHHITELGEWAYVFYRPLPQRALNVSDLVKFSLKEIQGRSLILLILSAVLIPLGWYVCSQLWQGVFTWNMVKGEAYILRIDILLLMAMPCIFLFGYYKGVMRSGIVEKVSYSLKSALMARLLSFKPVFFKENDSGSMASWIFEIDTMVRCAVSGFLITALDLIAALIYINAMQEYMYSVRYLIRIIFFIHLACFFFSIFLRRGIAWPLAKRASKEYAFSHELLRSIDKIKLRGARKRLFSKWSSQYLEKASLKYDLPFFLRVGNLPSITVSFVFLVYYYYVVDRRGISIANFVAFIIVYGLFMSVMLALPRAAQDIAAAEAVVRLIRPIMDSQVETGEKAGVFKRISGRISLKRVSFRYDAREPQVVDNLSLDIAPGEYVAVTGRSGCGKTTLVRLILGYETPDSGGVFFDDVDVRSLDMQYVRRQIGCVLQNGALFDGDIFSNISFCAPDLTMDEAWEIAEIAGIADDIRAMPMGMHTVITGRGECLSGGQRQRLMIARAIASKPKVLIFDEATSALDNITQQKVSRALDELGCTRIVIAHRLSTVERCNRIIVMDEGRIADEGDFKTLMEKNGVFRELVELQSL